MNKCKTFYNAGQNNFTKDEHLITCHLLPGFTLVYVMGIMTERRKRNSCTNVHEGRNVTRMQRQTEK